MVYVSVPQSLLAHHSAQFLSAMCGLLGGEISLDCLNNSLFTLIPKKLTPESVNDFCPISLINWVLRVLTKILAKRLQKWVLLLVHRNQYGFIKSRRIQDCLAWAFEYLNQWKTSRHDIVLLKLDFEKAFDMLQHSYILNILKRKDFSEHWIMWIVMILESGSSSILLTGVPRPKFKCKHGVRQGDPLSPLLFIFAADFLQSPVNKASHEGYINLPINQPASEDFLVIQYGDDTILVVPASSLELLVTRTLLDSYAKATSLKINYHKSQLIPINV